MSDFINDAKIICFNSIKFCKCINIIWIFLQSNKTSINPMIQTAIRIFYFFKMTLIIFKDIASSLRFPYHKLMFNLIQGQIIYSRQKTSHFIIFQLHKNHLKFIYIQIGKNNIKIFSRTCSKLSYMIF